MAKLIRSTSLTANGDEINCAEATGKMRRMIELLAHDTRHAAIISLVAMSW
jgi:hypothetical protein